MNKTSALKAWFAQINDSHERIGSKEWYMAYGKIVFGCLLFALIDLFCVVPYGLAPGGVYGLMSVFNNIWGVPMNLVIYMDVTLLLIGFVFLGPRFGIKTILSIFLIWLFTYITEILLVSKVGYFPVVHSGNIISIDDYNSLTDQIKNMYLPIRPYKYSALGITHYFQPDYLLASVVGGLVYGISIGIIFSAGATSGGSDIISMIIHKYTHISLGVLVMIVDSSIALTAIAIDGSIRLPVYSIILIYIECIIIDKIVDTKINRTLLIVSEHTEEIKQLMTNKLERKVSIIQQMGTYNGNQTQILYATVSKPEYKKLKNELKKIDSKIFINLINNTEVSETNIELNTNENIDLKK